MGRGTKYSVGGYWTGCYVTGNRSHQKEYFSLRFNFKELVHSLDYSIHPHKTSEAGEGERALLSPGIVHPVR